LTRPAGMYSSMQSGAVSVVQRVNSDLRLNPHLHTQGRPERESNRGIQRRRTSNLTARCEIKYFDDVWKRLSLFECKWSRGAARKPAGFAEVEKLIGRDGIVLACIVTQERGSRRGLTGAYSMMWSGSRVWTPGVRFSPRQRVFVHRIDVQADAYGFELQAGAAARFE
jgi:hypothetical protein